MPLRTSKRHCKKNSLARFSILFILAASFPSRCSRLLSLPSHFSAAATDVDGATTTSSSTACQLRDAPPGEDAAASTCSNSITSVYVIGDLHGDAVCAVSWVNRTGLIANLLLEDDDDKRSDSKESTTPLYKKLTHPSQWRWTSPHATLVFLGDYVDKGPTSKQTVEFVKDLTTAFPEKVTAILGNHELELLRDRDSRIEQWERYSSYSYGTVHPGEYLNYFASSEAGLGHSAGGAEGDQADDADPAKSTKIRPLDENDGLVLDLLYEAGMEVYSFQAHGAVRFVPSLPPPNESQPPPRHQRRGVMYAITDIMPPQHRALAKERLEEYQSAYLDAFRSDSPLGKWMERRPILHLSEDIRTLFVHGGVSPGVASTYLRNGKKGVNELNRAWWNHSHEGALYDFLNGKVATAEDVDDVMGYVIYELLTHRGNHPGYSRWESHGTVDEHPADEEEACEALRETLRGMEGIDRDAVGHTPYFGVRVLCDGAFLALDSTLGRWIRGSGNEYCPGPEHLERRGRGVGTNVEVARTSRDGRYRCADIKEACEGEIVRLDSDGTVNILSL